MQYIITIAGAIQLAGWFMALIELDRGNRKAPCAQAVQSKAQRAITTNHRKGGRYGHYTGLPTKNQQEDLS